MEGGRKAGDPKLQTENILASSLQSVSLNDEQYRTQPEVPQSTMQSGQSEENQECCQLLVSGIPHKVSKDYLTNYLECLPVIECDVKDIEVGTKRGVAIVTFAKSVDLRNLQSALSRNPLENTTLQVSTPDSRGAIMICNPHPDTADNSFLYYLCNTRRSGGEKGVKIERYTDNLIAYFSSMKVATAVAERCHELEQQYLDVVAFNPNLGPPKMDDKKDAHLEENVGDVSGAAEGDLLSGDGNVSLHEKLESFKEELEAPPRQKTISVNEIHFLYLGILNAFSEMIQQMFSGIYFTVEHEVVEVTGDEAAVECLEKLLYNLLLKQRASEFIQSLPESFEGWYKILEDIEEKVDVTESACSYFIQVRESLTPSGSCEDELCVGTLDTPLTFDQFLETFASRREVWVKENAQQDLLASTVWDEFVEGEFEGEFGDQMLAIKNEEGTRVTLFGSAKHLDKAVDAVQQFLQNTQKKEFLPLSALQQQFLQDLRKKQLEKLETGTGYDAAKLHFEKAGCEVSGMRTGVWRAVDALKTMCKQLMYIRVIFSYFGILKYAATQEWNHMLQAVTKEHKCIISELPDLSVEDADADCKEWGPWTATVLHSFCSASSTRCHLVEGDVLSMKVDAVVLCREPNKYPREGDGTTQRNAGARPKVYQFNSRGSTSGSSSGLTVTQPGALPCKAVIEVDLEKYFSNDATVHGKSLMILMSEILQVAENHCFSSLAIPAIGVDVRVGPTAFPIDIATGTIVQCIHQYFDPEGRHRPRQERKSKIEDICLCSERAACLRGFQNALECTPMKMTPLTPSSYKMLSCGQDSAPSRHGRLHNRGTIQIIEGDISDIKADVVIVPLDEDMDVNKNKVTRALAHNGGPSEYDLTHRWRVPFFGKKMDPQDWEEKFAEERFMEGSHGSRNACHIFYLYLPPWGPEVRKTLTQLLQRCMHEADKKACKSIALTALGVGKLDYSPEFSARTMLTVISNYMEQNMCSVESVKIVIFPSYNKETYNIFSREQFHWQKQAASGPQHEAYRDRPMSYSQAASPKHTGGSRKGKGGGRRGRGHGGGGRGSSRQSGRLVHGNPYKDEKSFHIGQVKLTVKVGNLIHEECDIIVNSSNDDLDLSKGGVSRALMKHCGMKLQEECKKKKFAWKMKLTGHALTPAPSLGKKKILHVDLAKYMSEPVKTLKTCLEVTRDCSTLKSIAFPAFGTGEAAKDPKVLPMASALVEAVKKFKKHKQVNDVRLILGNQDLFQEMLSIIESMLAPSQPHSGQQGQRTSDKPSRKSSGMEPLVYPPHEGQSHSSNQTPPLTYPTHTQQPYGSEQSRPIRSNASSTSVEAVSVYIFSDNDEDRQAAEDDLRSRIETQLSYLADEYASHGSQPPPCQGAYDSRSQGRYQSPQSAHGGRNDSHTPSQQRHSPVPWTDFLGTQIW